ncbi:urease accessory protein UreF [Roseitalea porphyridii]|uniref:Urease accessory protein UreF n=1 Tax=Roseitalea porphyridii TaxID=1852022 RepID=A0A4P6V3F4_9HYPH|nr:urease accessory UreF family protein [Roseitalea porphyridii]QBK31294.1 urease accessory protein UreF [Roseitalea porphyridii]
MSADTRALVRLMSWLSPVFPTGGFAYSAGLEEAVAVGTVDSEPSLAAWLEAGIARGAPWNDAVLLAEAHRAAADRAVLADLSALARALSVSAGRHRETVDQGAAFRDAASAWITPDALPPRDTPLPVAVGAAAGLADIARKDVLAAYLNTFATNQVQCAIRLSVTGQSGAARVLAALEPVIAKTAARAAEATLDDLGSCAIGSDIASMNHEMRQPRLFLS